MKVETVGRHFGAARLHRIQQRLVDEHVLVLGLNHVVTLGSEAGHVTVHVQRLLVLNAIEHRVNHDVRASPSDTSTTATRHIRLPLISHLPFNWPSSPELFHIYLFIYLLQNCTNSTGKTINYKYNLQKTAQTYRQNHANKKLHHVH